MGIEFAGLFFMLAAMNTRFGDTCIEFGYRSVFMPAASAAKTNLNETMKQLLDFVVGEKHEVTVTKQTIKRWVKFYTESCNCPMSHALDRFLPKNRVARIYAGLNEEPSEFYVIDRGIRAGVMFKHAIFQYVSTVRGLSNTGLQQILMGNRVLDVPLKVLITRIR